MILVSDLHFNRSNYREVADVLRQACDLARETDKIVSLLGDTNDTKAIIRGEFVQEILDVISTYNDITFYVLIGNHDLLNVKNDMEHSLEFLRYLPNVFVMDNKRGAESRVINNIGFIPYKNDEQDILNDIEKMKALGIDTLFMHQGIRGAQINCGRINKEDMNPSSLLDLEVFVGHYHLPHDVGDNIHYIGSTLSHSFGESNQQKYLIDLDTNTGLYEQIPSEARQHITYSIKEDEALPKVQHKDNDIIRVIIEGSKQFVNTFDRKEIDRMYGKNTKIVPSYTKDDNKVIIKNTLNKEQIIDLFVDNQSIPDHMKPIMKNKMQVLYKEIINA